MDRPTEEQGSASGASSPATEEVDVSLIRWMLSLRPIERLRVLQNHIRAIEALRSARERG